MAGIFGFKCSCCGKMHEGAPNFGYSEPAPYLSLSEEQKRDVARINSDLCEIRHPDRTDYFVRAILEIPIHGIEDPFTWGVWSSLSEKSYNRYVETYDDPVSGETFFGWVCNRFPCYPAPNGTFSADVVVQAGGTRPKLILHPREELADHPLILDQRNGITIAQAQKMAEEVMHGIYDDDAKDKSGDHS